ncbi:MAG: hypothetical protein ACLFM7_00980 [Bacteroidales bacterium]
MWKFLLLTLFFQLHISFTGNVSYGEADFYPGGGTKPNMQHVCLNPEREKPESKHSMWGFEEKNECLEEFPNRKPVKRRIPENRIAHRAIDTLDENGHFGARMNAFETLSSGYYPFRFLNIDLTKLLDYNKYEGLRLGLGLMTNDSISELFSVGGYFGYGFRDRDWKYGGRLMLKVHEETESRLEFSYRDDVAESGGYRFLKEQSVLSPAMYRQYLVENMDRVKEKQMSYSLKGLRYLRLKFFVRHSLVNPFTEYLFIKDNQIYGGNFYITESGLKARFAWKEEFAETPWGKLSFGADYPVVYANYTRGMNVLNGDFEYNKIEAAVSYEMPAKNPGKTRMQLVGGLARGSVPAFKLYFGHGAYGSRFSIYSENSFATMRLSEFLADRFISVYLNQDFGSLLFGERGFSPQILWLNNLGWGWLDNPSRHQGIDTQSFDKGYFETGLMIEDLLGTNIFSYGLGVFYRYGPYAFDNFSDNLACKVSIKFNL